jgi:hypothetical protein
MKVRVRWMVGAALGASAGYVWYSTVGCTGGGCPISSDPLVSTLYGAGVGLLMANMSKPGP